ncbi:hypothetical protein ACFWYW_55615 [Nonomuraea sp. NPDC059023]|uniref:hypothetical protein n=1 Tax=unclassified Nonomuraea TaxID=2593643 RepID=UPI0036C16EA0
MTALACVKDVELRLGRTFTSDEAGRASVLLDDASALVRAYTRQDFAPPAPTTVVLRASGGVVRLPKRPVTAVTSVVMVGMYGSPDITVVGWGWDGLDVIDVSGWTSCIINLPEAVYEADDLPSTYRVTYTHGYATVPPVVVAVVAGMVGRTMAAPTTTSGLTSETIGSYSYRLAEPGVGTAVSLTSADKELLDAAGFRARAATIPVRLR